MNATTFVGPTQKTKQTESTATMEELKEHVKVMFMPVTVKVLQLVPQEHRVLMLLRLDKDKVKPMVSKDLLPLVTVTVHQLVNHRRLRNTKQMI